MPQEWSGFVTVNSLPSEVRSRRAGMSQLIESAMHTPNIPVGERRWGIPSGYPAVAESMPGGAVKVSVNTLAIRGAAMPIGNDSEVGDDAPLDAFGRAAHLNATFREFFKDTVGRVRVQEIGPKAGYLGAPGIYADDFPHRPGYGSRRARGDNDPFGRPGQPRRSYSRSRDAERTEHLGQDCALVHPTMSHLDWQDSEEETQERYLGEARRSIRITEARETRRHESRMAAIEQKYHSGLLPHYGLMSDCRAAHPGQTHSAWRSS